jgi:hypothetical protein
LNNKNAKPGHSKHERGFAIDINLVSLAGKQYKKDTSLADWLSTGVPQLAAKLGIKWGGNSFVNYFDPIHFELPNVGRSETIVQDIYETRRTEVKQSSLDVGKLFSNFKVNEYVFNFFLRGEQKNLKYRRVLDRGVYDDNGNKTLSEVIIKTKK